MSQAEDRDEIKQLIATYTANGDRGRVSELAWIFAEDAVMTTSQWRAEGRAAIAKALGGSGGAQDPERMAKALAAGARGPIMRHHLTSCYITFDGPDEATGRNYWINFSEHGPDHSGLYSDKYRRIDGEWRIVSRDVRLDWKSPNSWAQSQLVGPRPADMPPPQLITAD